MKDMQGVEINGYTNKWSCVDTYGTFGMFENDTWGDETCYLICEEQNGKLVVIVQQCAESAPHYVLISYAGKAEP